MRAKTMTSTLAAGLLLGLTATSANASLTGLFTGGVVNTFDDQANIIIYDVNGDGLYNAGDIINGILRIDDKVAPPPSSSLGSPDRATAVFSIVVTGTAPGVGGLTYAPTPLASPFSLASLGVPGAVATSMAAVYSTIGFDPFSGPFPAGPFGDVRDGVAGMIASGLPQLVLGMGGPGDYFNGLDTLGIGGGPLALGYDQPKTTALANISAGLTVEIDNVGGIDFAREVCSGLQPGGMAGQIPNAGCAPINAMLPGSLHDVLLTGQLLGGGTDPVLAGFDAVNGVAFFGQTGDLIFSLAPLDVPEPGALGLLGLGLIGIAFGRRRALKA